MLDVKYIFSFPDPLNLLNNTLSSREYETHNSKCFGWTPTPSPHLLCLKYKLLFASHLLLHHRVVQCSKKQSHGDAKTTSWNSSHESQQTIILQYIPQQLAMSLKLKLFFNDIWYFPVIWLCWHLYNKKFPDPLDLFSKTCSRVTYINFGEQGFLLVSLFSVVPTEVTTTTTTKSFSYYEKSNTRVKRNNIMW